MFRTSVAAALSLTALAACSAPPQRLSDAQIKAVNGIVRRAMASQHIPGIVICVAREGRILYANAFGRRADHYAVDADTIFPIGSIAKQFTAAAVMLLVQDGRMQLDSPVERYLSGVPHAKEITVRELLDQTSGLVDYSMQPGMQKAIGPTKLTPVSPRALLKLIADKPL